MRQIAGYMVLALLSLLPGCRDFGPESEPPAILRGQVYLISKPGPIPIGWIPPPLEQVNTIIVLSTEKDKVREVTTDSRGSFSFSIAPGTYYLRVKESPIPAETGPFLCTSGASTLAEAHFDNGMR
jgi:hypothetical protein